MERENGLVSLQQRDECVLAMNLTCMVVFSTLSQDVVFSCAFDSTTRVEIQQGRFVVVSLVKGRSLTLRFSTSLQARHFHTSLLSHAKVLLANGGVRMSAKMRLQSFAHRFPLLPAPPDYSHTPSVHDTMSSALCAMCLYDELLSHEVSKDQDEAGLVEEGVVNVVDVMDPELAKEQGLLSEMF